MPASGPSDHSRHRRPLGAAATCAVLAVLVGCAPASTPRSNTPRISVSETVEGAPDLLLGEQDLRAIDGLADVQAQQVGDLGLFENPDPRGPCGGVVPKLPTQGAVGRAFTGGPLVAIELVSPATAEQRAYVGAIIGDRTSACGPFQSKTNQGATQTIGDIEFVELAGGGDTVGGRTIAWTSRVEVAGASAYAGIGMLEGGGHVAFIQVLAGEPISHELLSQLAAAALTKLQA